MAKCRICGETIEPFMSFGQMPIANGFLTEDQFTDEYFFELKVAFCAKCKMFQLLEQPKREMMFNENYAFFSGTSKGMAVHFEQLAKSVIRDYLQVNSPFVVEIGSNDGIMLKHIKNSGIRHLGIEPSANVAKIAQADGINTITEFFDKNLAERIVKEYGHANAFIGANVMCHIPYFHSIIDGIDTLLCENGVVVFEDPYLGSVIEKTTYDQIYDEHVFLFSLHSISFAFEMHGFEVFDIATQETHGGSMRYFICRKGKREISRNVAKLREYEKEIGLDREETYSGFRRNCELFKNKLMNLVEIVIGSGKKIVGYAATSKSTTIINYCGLTTKHIDYICDTTPIKQGKFSPGAHIPIKPYSEFETGYPDYALLFGYNHEKEIMEKEKYFMAKGGKWIVYVPEIKIK